MTAAWPERLIGLARRLRSLDAPERDSRRFGEFWHTVTLALRYQVRSRAGSGGGVSEQDVEDIASEKALELVNRFDSRVWRPEEDSPAQVAAFVRTVARNGLVDHWRRERRRIPGAMEDQESMTTLPSGPDDPEFPEAAVQREDFAAALVACASTLSPRNRTIWIFRVFYGLSSRVIAAHPELNLNAPHVDVIIQRCRRHITACMDKKGFPTTETPPPGAFAALWAAFRLDAAAADRRNRD